MGGKVGEKVTGYRKEPEDSGGHTDIDEPRRIERIMLFAGSGSGQLTGMLSTRLRELWLEMAGLSEDDLAEDQRRDLRFIASGVVAMYGDSSLSQNPVAIADFITRPLGAGVVETFRELAGLTEGPPPHNTCGNQAHQSREKPAGTAKS